MIYFTVTTITTIMAASFFNVCSFLDTPGTNIYFTVNGGTPQPPKKSGHSDKSTALYKGPFLLNDGKKTIKALAVSRDGQQSSVVTKVFHVEYSKPGCLEGMDENDGVETTATHELRTQESHEGASVFSTNNVGRSWNVGSRKAWQENSEKTNEWMFKPQQDSLARNLALQPQKSLLEISPAKTMSSLQTLRLQRELDFLKCPKCLAPRPSDPLSRFCTECGTLVPAVPRRRLPPPDNGKMGICQECKSLIPLTTPECLVCETPIAPQLQPQASIRLKEKVFCKTCGTGNPANLRCCVTCESHLPETSSVGATPPTPKHCVADHLLGCSQCGRANSSDALFCDWCGTKPQPSKLPTSVTCSQCGASSPPYSKFCASCGVFMKPPARPGTCSSTTTTSRDGKGNTELAKWEPLLLVPPVVAAQDISTKEQGTQTKGLFYKNDMSTAQHKRQEKTSDRRPPLSASSPGRGYWRSQLDHVCAHLRCFTQNNPEFRALFAEPCMGKMVSGALQVDDIEVTLKLTFSQQQDKGRIPCDVREDPKPQAQSPNVTLSSVMDGGGNGKHQQQILHNSLASDICSSLNSTAGGRKSPKKRQKALNAGHPSTIDRLLLQELGADGKGRADTLQKLMDDGANPNCVDSEGRPALSVAVRGGHPEAVIILVQRGAHVDRQAGPHNNSALHRAVEMGARGLLCAEALLRCQADVWQINSHSLTPYDIAVKKEHEPLITLLASRMGQGLLDKLRRPGGTIK
uniref:Double zinc ribbon and ankyrin repeat-containing protein 1 n=1 Tax=Eptatretus burgeri TaxID=7764 RepID=A0A8C4QF24_EPTBU